MFRFTWMVCLAIPLFSSAGELPRLMDTQGVTHRLGDRDEAKASVVVFLGPECPISQRYVPTLKRIHKEFSGKIEFFGVVSGDFTDRAEAAKFHKEFDPSFPVLFDASNELAGWLRPTHVPEAFLIDMTGAVLYRGRIDDGYEAPGKPRAQVREHDLKNAIEEVLAGKKPSMAKTVPVGCIFEELPKDATTLPEKVTYSRHIAPILFGQCVDCHRPGEVAPFSLLTYSDASKRAKQLLQVVKDKTMPPWHAEKNYGHFLDERRLEAREIALLEAWVKQGSPEGKKDDLPPTPSYPGGWRLGKPDLIIKMPEKFTLPASGPDIQQLFVIPSGVTEDKMVGAFEFHPGNPKIVHHAICFLDSNGAARKLDEASPGPGYGFDKGLGFLPTGALGGWAPGNRPRWVPEGMGRYFRAGSDLVVQVHYHPSGKEETDQSEMGIYFVRKPAKQFLGGFAVENWDISIDPEAKEYRRKAEFTLPVNINLVGIAPHMHLLGKEMKAWAILPDGKKQSLVHVPRWDFNWQDEYFYKQPLRLPKGTKIHLEGSFDNSSSNPKNPHSPPKKINWGEGTYDEMCLCAFECTCDSVIDLFALLAEDLAKRKVFERFSMGVGK